MKKLREYKGVAFDPTKAVFLYEGCHFGQAVDVIFHNSFLTDDDHAELMWLKADPYEPVPTLEDVIESAYDEWRGGYSRTGYKELIAKRIREAFPHIDGEGV